MNKYENICILRGSLTEEQAQKENEEIKKYFENVKTFEEKYALNGYQGQKKLAYEIKGEKQGYFIITYFMATKEEVAKIDKQLRLNNNIIKFITIEII